MKKLCLVFILLISIQSIRAQVFSGTQEIERATKEGVYTTVSIEDKYIKQSWQNELAKYGSVEVGRNNVFRITGARISSISPDPVMVVSKITAERGRSKIFLSIGFGDEVYVNGSHPKYLAAEKILNDFVEVLKRHEEVRIEEKNVEDIKTRQLKSVTTSDKLTRAIENNKKEKDRLLLKIEENRVELERLQMEVEQNKKDQLLMNEGLINQQKKVEEAKLKLKKP
ncbi:MULTISPECIES: hypothetical protein [unclassified Arcicella]|uniref:hypothetical protein n=1 Tax=unclassified Arcicella TaxID=2644986 RepID=UPI0028644CBC|nr:MULTISPECIES: hypothetical protein [unclassified Arcicella]MDR6562716.1 hypothetical protein [Arcicella sp. BE51]MDR6812939.1 hypothetical protein [Arcicella sp. BE140]MDR6824253.1 hypothetical protein [Arcicella sp. BE139]